MIELIRGAVEWAREQDVSPWTAIWLIVGYMGLRLLSMVGHALTRTASGLFAHYNGVISTLEKRIESQQHELASLKAELAERNRELVQSQQVNSLLHERLNLINAERRPNALPTSGSNHDSTPT
jgi:hypothetical protein